MKFGGVPSIIYDEFLHISMKSLQEKYLKKMPFKTLMNFLRKAWINYLKNFLNNLKKVLKVSLGKILGKFWDIFWKDWTCEISVGSLKNYYANQ